jgi:hypothetical protein
LLVCLGIGKNISISICPSKGESTKTTNQGFRTKEEMYTTLENRKKVATNSPRNALKKNKKLRKEEIHV